MLTWIAVGFVLWLLGFGFVMALMRMASDEDRCGASRGKAPRSILGCAGDPIRQRGLKA